MNKNESKQHWEHIYSEKLPQEVSWFQREPTVSLQIIKNISDHHARIIDVGGGASVLVDHLLMLRYSNIAVLDISGAVIELLKKRLKEQAGKIEWYEQDITEFVPSHAYDIWHDRAVFHFLVDKKSRDAYVDVLKNTIKSGGHVIIATFAKDGPTQCSGLDIVQYDSASIQHELGDAFTLLACQAEIHLTPKENEQRFMYFTFQRK